MNNDSLITLNIDKQEYTSNEILTIIGLMVGSLKTPGKNTININKNDQEFKIHVHSALDTDSYGSIKIDND